MKGILAKVRKIGGKVFLFLAVAIAIGGLVLYALWELTHPYLARFFR